MNDFSKLMKKKSKLMNYFLLFKAKTIKCKQILIQINNFKWKIKK